MNEASGAKESLQQLFVGGCHPDMEDDEFMDYFAQFGEIKEGRLVRDKLTKKFRGFGFITFAANEISNQVMKQKHVIRGKAVQLKVAISKEQTRLKLLDEKMRKLFIMNIDRKMTKSQFQQYFQKYGKIDQVKVVHEHRKNGQEKNYAFVLFNAKDSMQKVFDEGEIHQVSGFKIECKPTLLRDELKQIHLDKLKKETNKNDEKKKKKKKKKKKNERKNNERKNNTNKKGREFKKKEKEQNQPRNDIYVKKSIVKKIKINQSDNDIESCWNAESSVFQSKVKPPSIKENQQSSAPKKGGPSSSSKNPEDTLSNKVSIDNDNFDATPKKGGPLVSGKNQNNKKRKSMGSATRPSETLIPDDLAQNDGVNRSNPFANTRSHTSSLNFSTGNPFTPNNNHQDMGLNNHAQSFYPPNYETNQHQNTHMFDYYPKDSLSEIFTPNTFRQPQYHPQNDQNFGQQEVDMKDIEEQINHRNRRRGNATLWKSDLIDSVNKYANEMKEPVPPTSVGQNNPNPRGNTGYNKQDPAHPGFNMYRMLPYETKSEALGRASQFSALTYGDRSSSDMVHRNYGMTGFNGFNHGVNTNYIPQQAHYPSMRTTDPSLAANRPSGLRMGPNAEMNRKTTSDFYRTNKTPNTHYTQQQGRLTDQTALQNSLKNGASQAHYEQYVLGFRVVEEGLEKDEESDLADEFYEEEFSDDSQDDGYNPKSKKKGCFGILRSTNNQNDEIY